MGSGQLNINVFADNVAQPVENADIEIIGTERFHLRTNREGQAETVTLSCPDKSFSLSPQHNVRPYSTYTITVRKPDLLPITVQGIEILDGCNAVQNVLMPSYTLQHQYQDDYIPEHTLWGDYPPKIVVDPATQEGIPIPGDVLPNPVVPEIIIVHDGLPTTATAPNYSVPFADYIKNVASSEIYATWPKETLKANVYCILSFALSRVYSEWYFSKGYPFTITSSTQFDQKFIYGRNIFKEISDVVDEIFNKFIRKGNYQQPFFSQYNDGIKVNNAGWLSQWGSKYLGDQGYDALSILRYYYGQDVSLGSAPIIEGIPFSFPGYVLQVGICGLPVQQVQTQLNVIRTSFPSIPLIDVADGNFGAKTKAAVESFQKIFNMPVSGVVDAPTWYRISYIYVAVSKMLAGRYELQ